MFELFNGAVKEGMTDFTLYRVPAGWQASSRWHSSTGWRVSIDRSLEEAVRGALSIHREEPKLVVDLGAEDLI